MEIHILWGGPGQGKSTYIAEQLGIWAAANKIALGRTLVLGPTGVACVSLADSLGSLPRGELQIMTLARFALVGPGLSAVPQFDAVVIDEFWACSTEQLLAVRGALQSRLAPQFCLLLSGDPMQLPPPDNAAHKLHTEWISTLRAAHPAALRVVRLSSAIPPRFARAHAPLPPELAPDVPVREIDALAWATVVDDLWHARAADPDVAAALAALWTQPPPKHAFTLTATIAAARAYNTECVKDTSGVDPEYLHGSCPKTLRGLKAGMPVIVRRNLNITRRWVNGTQARISAFSDACVILVRDSDSDKIGVSAMPRFDSPRELEYPFSLGFASTVHSLQGCTMTEPYVIDDSILRARYTPYTLFLVAVSRAVCPSLIRVRGARAGEVVNFLTRNHTALRQPGAAAGPRELLERLGQEAGAGKTLRHSKLAAGALRGAGNDQTRADAPPAHAAPPAKVRRTGD